MSNIKISPSFLAADFGNVKSEVEMLNSSEADYIHIDIMDGVFVPNISFGFPVCAAIYKHAKKPMDFHLMVTDPNPYLQNCVDTGAEIITVHYETCNHLHRTIAAIKELGVKAGVAINPHVAIEQLFDILPFVDLVLLMSVNPGFGGQKFIETTYDRVTRLKEKILQVQPEILVEIDGGVNATNAKKLIDCGADMLVAGSFIFNSNNPKQTIAELKKL